MAETYVTLSSLKHYDGKIREVIDEKQDQLVGTEGQVVSFDADGNVIAKDLEKVEFDTSNLVEKEEGKGLFSGSYNDLTDKPTIPSTDGLVSNETLNNTLKDYAKQSDIPTSLPASDVFDWAKAENKPNYTFDEVGADKSGSASEALSDAKEYTDDKVADVSAAIGNKANASDLNMHTGNTTVHITSTERTNWNSAKTHADSAHAPSDAEKNIIVGIQKNGTDVTVNASTRKVNITVPTKVSELTNDSGYAKTSDIPAAYDDTAIKNRVTATENAITTLNGTGTGSVKQTVDNAINDFATKVSNDGVVNTYKELVDYAAEHSSEITEMAGDIADNTSAISDLDGRLDTVETKLGGHTVGKDVPSDAKFTDTVTTATTSGTGNAVTAISASNGKLTVTKGSTFLTAHPTISTSADTTSTQTATHGGTVTMVDSITKDANGHITKVNTKTVTLPADNNTDTKVSQTLVSDDATYPLLLATKGQTATSTTTACFDSGVTLNPSTNTIAANVSGNAATATKLGTATKGSATQPIYLNAGAPTACTYTLGKSVPSNAVFTDTTYDVVTDSANGLMSPNLLSKLNAAWDYADSIIPTVGYATCSTAAATAAKVVTLTGTTWKLTKGSMIAVKFTNTNTAENPTLNVNSTGAKPVYYNTAVITTSNLGYAGTANRVANYVYDGTNYVFIGWSTDSNTTYTNASLGQGYATCSTAANTVAKTASLSSYTLTTGGIVSVKFANAVPASATLNINSKGAKPIYYNGAAIPASKIVAGDIATFIYDGSYYHLISLDKGRSLSRLIAQEMEEDTLPGMQIVLRDSSNLYHHSVSGLINYTKEQIGTSEWKYDISPSPDFIVTDSNGSLHRMNIDCMTDAMVNHADGILYYLNAGNAKTRANGYTSKLTFWRTDKTNGSYIMVTASTVNSRLEDTMDFYVTANTGSLKPLMRVCLEGVQPLLDDEVNLGAQNKRWTSIYSCTALNVISDRNAKNTIINLDEQKVNDFIMGLKPVSYKLNGGTSGRTHYGLIAQDVEELMDSLGMTSLDFAGFTKSPKYEEIVTTKTRPILDANGNPKFDEDGNEIIEEYTDIENKLIENEYSYGLRYEEFISPLIKVVQTQQNKLNEQEERIAKLEAMVAELAQKIEQ